MRKNTLKELLKSINPNDPIVIYRFNGLLALHGTPNVLLQQLSDKQLSRQVKAKAIDIDHIALYI